MTKTTTKNTNKTTKTTAKATTKRAVTKKTDTAKKVQTIGQIRADKKKAIEAVGKEYEKKYITDYTKLKANTPYIPIIGLTSNGVLIADSKQLYECLDCTADEFKHIEKCNKYTDDDYTAFWVVLQGGEKYDLSFPNADKSENVIATGKVFYNKTVATVNIYGVMTVTDYKAYSEKIQTILTEYAEKIAKRQKEIEVEKQTKTSKTANKKAVKKTPQKTAKKAVNA